MKLLGLLRAQGPRLMAPAAIAILIPLGAIGAWALVVNPDRTIISYSAVLAVSLFCVMRFWPNRKKTKRRKRP